MSHLFKQSRDTWTSKDQQKVVDQDVVFFNTFQYGVETDVWDQSTSNGGTAAHDPANSGVTLTVTNTINSEVIRQTRNVVRYVPGRSSVVSFAIRFGTPAAGIRRRIGLFDGSDGFYFEDGGDGDYYCCVANSGAAGGPALERIPRADWNGDKLDGNGPSGITADPEAQQLVVFEYEWYGSGAIKFGWVIDGEIRIIHTFYSANRLNGVWCRTPFLPIRIEIKNTTGGQAGDNALHQGSNSVSLDGSRTQKLGISENIQTSTTGITLDDPNVYYPLLSIRLKSTNLQAIVLPTVFQVATVDNTNVFYKVVRNATLNGTWVDMPDANSFAQYNITASGALTGGTTIDSGFVIQGLGGGGSIRVDKDVVYQIGRSSMGTVSDTLTIAGATSTTNKSGLAALTWIEQR